MSNLNVLITGGHTGLGLGVTKRALEAGHKIGLIVRSASRKEKTLADFADISPELVGQIDWFYADLSIQTEVKRVAGEIRDQWPHIDRLFNNAGIVVGGRKNSPQNNELHLEINALAPIILTRELKPLLMAAEKAIVINTGTDGMQSRNVNVGQLTDPSYTRGMNLYMQSKQALMLLMNEEAKDFAGVQFITVNPGPNKTKMTTGGGTPGIIKFIARLFFKDPSVGSQRIYDAGFAAKYADQNQVYISYDEIKPLTGGAISASDRATLLAGLVAA